jgi:hypothetical protein
VLCAREYFLRAVHWHPAGTPPRQRAPIRGSITESSSQGEHPIEISLQKYDLIMEKSLDLNTAKIFLRRPIPSCQKTNQ